MIKFTDKRVSSPVQTRRSLRVLLVDPSLFTPTYDKALADGLVANGASVACAIRATRAGEDEDDLADYPEAYRFYRLSDHGRGPRGRLGKMLKGLEHWYGMRRLTGIARRFDVVHFQWTPIPLIDAAAIRRIRRTTPVVLTVHDITPLNGAKNGVQVRGFSDLYRSADRLVVHTQRARDALIERGAPKTAVTVVPHGPLVLRRTPRCDESTSPRMSGRWRIVLFGRLKPYKGVDLLIEALGTLSPPDRDRLEVIVAGEPSIELDPILKRRRELGLTEQQLRFTFKRLTDQEMADLLFGADAFVFPYRTIDASGVLYLVSGLRKWIIASRHGAFLDLLDGNSQLGRLVDPEDAHALAEALIDSIGKKAPPATELTMPTWTAIGGHTLEIYRSLIPERA